MNHEEAVRKVLSSRDATGALKSRESNTVEFKESFNKANTPKYAKTMAAFTNNRGGYIIFGVKDNPRRIIGLKNDNFENLNQEQFSEAINSLFAPAMDWECGTLTLEKPTDKVSTEVAFMKIGWIYVAEGEYKPVIAQKSDSGEKINSGDVFYRYRGRSEKIRYAEMRHIIDERTSKEKEGMLRIFEIIRKSDTANLGIVNYSSGRISTPYGIDAAFDQKLVARVLKKAKFIKEGSFNETKGMPVIKVTGSIDLAEEVPVPEGNPDETHPYIQLQLAQKLGIENRKQDLYALIWYYRMKEARKYHLAITTSSKTVTHKFSEFALDFLSEKLNELENNPEDFDLIRKQYRDYKRSLQKTRKRK